MREVDCRSLFCLQQNFAKILKPQVQAVVTASCLFIVKGVLYNSKKLKKRIIWWGGWLKTKKFFSIEITILEALLNDIVMSFSTEARTNYFFYKTNTTTASRWITSIAFVCNTVKHINWGKRLGIFTISFEESITPGAGDFMLVWDASEKTSANPELILPRESYFL